MAALYYFKELNNFVDVVYFLVTQDHSTRLIAVKDLINQLPKVNHDTLKEIIFHLTKYVPHTRELH